MASITTRNLDDDGERCLRISADEHAQSVEERSRETLCRVAGEVKPAHNLTAAVRARIAPLGGIDLDLPRREPMSEPPDFDRA